MRRWCSPAGLGTAPLWLDELQQLVLRRESVAALLQWVQSNPRASPLPYLAQRATVDLFGTSAYVVRLPAALFLALPLQFRYGSSRAVRAREGGHRGGAAFYGASVALGLYRSP